MEHAELLIDGHFIGGPCDQATGKQVIRAPFGGQIVGVAAEGGYGELRGCIEAAYDAFATWSHSTGDERRQILLRIAATIRERRLELADLLVLEIAKPITWAQAEVERMAITFDLAAELAPSYGRGSAELGPDPRASDYSAEIGRFPIGVIFAMVPYNWPFNLAAHKLAPALASGNTIVLKVSPLAPISTLTLARLLHEVGVPPGVVNAWNGDVPAVERALDDPRIAMLSFTGSARVGWKLKERFNTRRVTLELGGDASVIVADDADLDWAIPRIVAGGYGYAGQICISIQHVLAARPIYDEFASRLAEATDRCPTGDPADPATVCGPLISEEAACGVESMVKEAVNGGARVLAGGVREGNLMRPTLLSDVPPSSRLAIEEVFGPVLTLAPYDSDDEAIRRVNGSKYGIHAGVFTHNEAFIERCFRDLEVGGVVINDYPTLRFDALPYGGVKQSGFGREGVRYAMDEMTELRTLVRRR